jgi:hypothetical protein
VGSIVAVAAHGAVGPARHRGGGGEALRVDVVQDDGRVGELRERQDVAQQVARELDAPSADEDDPGHQLPLPLPER